MSVLITVHVATFPKNNYNTFDNNPLAITSWSVQQDISQSLLCTKVASEILGWYTSDLENFCVKNICNLTLTPTNIPALPPPPPAPPPPLTQHAGMTVAIYNIQWCRKMFRQRQGRRRQDGRGSLGHPTFCGQSREELYCPTIYNHSKSILDCITATKLLKHQYSTFLEPTSTCVQNCK